MSGEMSVDVLIGFLLPPLIALVNQRRWSPVVKGLVALAACAAAATLAEALRAGTDWADWRGTALTVAAAAFGFYRVFWQPSRIAPRIEDATSAPVRPASGGPVG